MFSVASTFVVRAARPFQAAYEEPAVWTVSAQGRVGDSLTCAALALSQRLGAPVRLESLPG